AHIAETTSVYDSARLNGATLSLTCEIRSLPHVGSLSLSAVDGLPEGRIGSCCFFGWISFSFLKKYSICCSADFLGHLPKTSGASTARPLTHYKMQTAI